MPKKMTELLDKVTGLGDVEQNYPETLSRAEVWELAMARIAGQRDATLHDAILGAVEELLLLKKNGITVDPQPDQLPLPQTHPVPTRDRALHWVTTWEVEVGESTVQVTVRRTLTPS